MSVSFEPNFEQILHKFKGSEITKGKKITVRQPRLLQFVFVSNENCPEIKPDRGNVRDKIEFHVLCEFKGSFIGAT